jgi:hypothetical protein
MSLTPQQKATIQCAFQDMVECLQARENKQLHHYDWHTYKSTVEDLLENFREVLTNEIDYFEEFLIDQELL